MVEFVLDVDKGVVVEESAVVVAILFAVSEDPDINELDSVSKAEVFETLLLLLTPDEETEFEDEPEKEVEVLIEPAFEIEFVEVLKPELAKDEVLTDNKNIVHTNINNILINNFFLIIFPPM